jgi:hypothetical protein
MEPSHRARPHNDGVGSADELVGKVLHEARKILTWAPADLDRWHHTSRIRTQGVSV